MARKALAVGLAAVTCLLLAAFFVFRPKTYPVTALAVQTSSAAPLGLEVVATLPAGMAPSALLGKKIALSYSPPGAASPVSASSTVYAVFDGAGAYTGPSPPQTSLPLPPGAGAAIIQFAAPSPAQLAAFPPNALTVLASVPSGTAVRVS